MDAFSYLSVLLSIILGLAITQILKGVRGAVLSRERVAAYWPTYVFCAFLLILGVQSWWAMFTMREIPLLKWTFPMFAVVLLQATSLYMLAALVLPDFFGEQVVDLRKHYFAHRVLFFSLLVATLVVSLLKEWVLVGEFVDRANIAFHLGFIALSLGGVLTKREWYHKLVCLISLGVLVVYIALIFGQLK